MAISVTDWVRKNLVDNGWDKKKTQSKETYKEMLKQGISTMSHDSFKRKVREVYQANEEVENIYDGDIPDIKQQYPQWTEQALYDLIETETEAQGKLLKSKDLRIIADVNGFPVTLFHAYFDDTAKLVKSIHQNLGLGVHEKKQVQKLKDKIRILESENKTLIKQEVSYERIMEILEDAVSTYKPFSKPSKFFKKSSNDRWGVAILSDWHVDEIVDIDQMHGINEYSVAIAKERIHQTFNRIIENGQQFGIDCLHLDFIGDMISGNIHDLAENAEMHIIQQIIAVADYTSQEVQRLSQYFKTITAIGIAGNHSRIHPKPYFKRKNTMNFEMLMYEFIKRECKDIIQEFIIPESPFYVHNINGTNVLSMHGDQIRGGSGLSSVPGNLSRDVSLLDGVLRQVNKPFDVVHMGHLHSFNVTRSFSGAKVIMNGSLIGGNEFSINAIKKSEQPSQTFYIVDKNYAGIPKYIDQMTV
ncbi:MAG: hypothetical protein ACOCW8_02060 [bacterium]